MAQHVVLPLHIGAFPACCGAVIAEFGDDIGGRRCVPDQPSLLRRQPARARHARDDAWSFVDGEAVRLLRLDRAQERHRRPGAGKLLRPGARGVQRGPASAGRALPARATSHQRHRAHHRRQQPHARAACSATSAGSLAPTASASSGSTNSSANTARTRSSPASTACSNCRSIACAKTFAEWKDGRFEAERFVDDDGIDLEQPVRIHVVVEKKGDRIHFDFTSSADQTKGPGERARCRWCRRPAPMCLISLIDPHIFVEPGLLRRLHHHGARGLRAQPRASRRR